MYIWGVVLTTNDLPGLPLPPATNLATPWLFDHAVCLAHLLEGVVIWQKEIRMRTTTMGLLAFAAVLVVFARAPAADPPTTAPAVNLATGWTLLQEGQAQGSIETDAKHGSNPSPHVLHIAVTKTADPGEGRAGAVSDVHFAVDQGEWCDVTFSAVTERGSIGLVFSLENSDGKVLARTTLPEIGRARGRRGRAATQPTTVPVVWPTYLVSLHVRAADASAHVVITPIEPTSIWLDGMTLTPRQPGH
jgi:hypothetical protein